MFNKHQNKLRNQTLNIKQTKGWKTNNIFIYNNAIYARNGQTNQSDEKQTTLKIYAIQIRIMNWQTYKPVGWITNQFLNKCYSTFSCLIIGKGQTNRLDEKQTNFGINSLLLHHCMIFKEQTNELDEKQTNFRCILHSCLKINQLLYNWCVIIGNGQTN